MIALFLLFSLKISAQNLEVIYKNGEIRVDSDRNVSFETAEKEDCSITKISNTKYRISPRCELLAGLFKESSATEEESVAFILKTESPTSYVFASSLPWKYKKN